MLTQRFKSNKILFNSSNLITTTSLISNDRYKKFSLFRRKFSRLREEVQLSRSILSGESVKPIDVIHTQDIFPRNQPPFEVDYTGSLLHAKSPYNFALEEHNARAVRFLFHNRHHKTNTSVQSSCNEESNEDFDESNLKC